MNGTAVPWLRPALVWLAAALGGVAATQGAHSAEVHVAVAANFAAPMQRIARDFERDTGHQAVLAFGSTGQLVAQIRHGAPFSVLLAADEAGPAAIERDGLGLPGSRFTYATGRLVLWSTQPALVDGRGDVLRGGGIRRLAIANPRLAPYGAAAVQTLEALGLAQALRPALVQGENVAQAYQFVATENAPLGFVALSQVMVDGAVVRGSAWVVPAGLHAPIRQDAIVLARGRGDPAAAALVAYLRGDKARAVIRAHGYEL